MIRRWNTGSLWVTEQKAMIHQTLFPSNYIRSLYLCVYVCLCICMRLSYYIIPYVLPSVKGGGEDPHHLVGGGDLVAQVTKQEWTVDSPTLNGITLGYLVWFVHAFVQWQSL